MSGLRSSQETVTHIARINIVPGDRTDRIVGKRDRALARACARARNVERGDSAVRDSHEPVIYIIGIIVGSLNSACLIGYQARV
jgi:hypothetical protein